MFHRCYNLADYFLHLIRYSLIFVVSDRRLCHSGPILVSTDVSVEYFLNCSIFSGAQRPHFLFEFDYLTCQQLLGGQLSASLRAICPEGQLPLLEQ